MPEPLRGKVLDSKQNESSEVSRHGASAHKCETRTHPPRISSAMRCALAIAVAASVAFGQAIGQGVVSGTVIEASNGEPIRKAIVTLTLQGEPRRWATARTDASGQFTFAGLPPGKYDLRATKQGLGTATYGAGGAGEIGELISLDQGETRGGVKLLFIRSGKIAGHVLEADGDPASNVSVAVLRPGRNLGKRVLVNYRTATTDDRGEYRINGLDPGDYYLLASPENFGGGSRLNGNGVLTAQFYGGSREWKESTVLHIRSGESLTGVDFHLSAEQPHRIHGHVTGVPDLGPSPEPASSGRSRPRMRVERQENGIEVQITMTPFGEGAPHWTTGTAASPPDYSFDFGENPGGLYQLEAHVNVGNRVWAASQLFEARSAADEVLLTLAPSIDIKGQVRIEGELEPAKSDLQIRLVREGSRDETISGRPGAGGRFTLEQVPAGEWVLDVSTLPLGGFLKSANLGDKDIRFAPVSIEAGSAALPLNIVISAGTAKIDGEIESGTGDSKRAGIVLAPVGPFHDLARFYYGVVTDDNGKFHLAHVAPGKYKIFALEKMAPVRFRNPEAADQLDDLGVEIELTEGATLTVHPKLIPAERAREALSSGGRQ
jgi:hypothetical protein